MDEARIIHDLRNGVNQKGLRDHNERLILTVLQRNGPMPGSEIARRTHLSAQTVSVILRKLEADGLLLKGEPVRGKVGKPFVPMALNARGALSVGFKLGRRRAELALTDLEGRVLHERALSYDVALPRVIFDFIRSGLDAVLAAVGPAEAAKICGIGIAAPFEIWKWDEAGRDAEEDFLSWKDVSFEAELARYTDLPVFMVNDATSACWAEHVYGRGRAFSDYAYLYVSTFIGGGIVLGQSVWEGPHGNAGAFGAMRVGDRTGQVRPLLEVASIQGLEIRLAAAGSDPRALWTDPQDWSGFPDAVTDWIDETAHAIAGACVSACAVIDFEAVMIDGYLPPEVRSRLVARVAHHLPGFDSRGLIVPQIVEGSMGRDARAIGAACGPIYAQYFLGPKGGRQDL